MKICFIATKKIKYLGSQSSASEEDDSGLAVSALRSSRWFRAFRSMFPRDMDRPILASVGRRGEALLSNQKIDTWS